MGRRLMLVATVTLMAAMGVYLYFDGREYELRFTESPLQEKLSERLPISKNYFVVIEVVLDNPRVSLITGSDRLNAGLDVTLNLRLRTETKPLGGTVDVSGGIRYDAEAGQFFVTDPVIENLAVQGIPDKYTNRTNQVLIMMLTEYFSDRPLYTLDPSKFNQAVAAMVLRRVIVEENELVVTLGI